MSLGRIAIVCAAVGMIAAAVSGPGRAASLETLLMPGKLSSAHAKLESDCSQCHDRADRPRQAQLCSACHKAVAADIATRQGFHGRRPEIIGAQCSACHVEHRGREARITSLATATFNHERTDFRLDGAHVAVSCSGCHRAERKFRDTAGQCVDCHRKVDPHAGTLGSDCAACHDTARWSSVRFDHGKTRFALQARHAEIPCAACHAGNRWKDTPQKCASCHSPDDVHRGQRGVACGDCHNQRSWKDTKFDHARETGFALEGRHARAACQSCHRSGRFDVKLPKNCAGCHAAIDAHAGRMGSKCESCHGTDDWQHTHFEHERDTKFPLLGAHEKVGCHDCHRAALPDHKPARECAACHRAQDVHAGTLGNRCENCHGQGSWRGDLRFDHDLTDFPLVGQHVVVPCAQCHATQRFKTTAKACSSCHAADDVHKGNLGKDCARCHSPNAWNIWQFDHGRESGFALTGAHAQQQCTACHRRPAGEAKLGRDCAACHSNDDVHLGQFGRRCERCHSTISFRRARPQ